MKSKFFTLGSKDFYKGLITALLSAVSVFVLASIGTSTTTRQIVQGTLLTLIGTFFGYIGKNLFTNSKDQFATPEPK